MIGQKSGAQIRTDDGQKFPLLQDGVIDFDAFNRGELMWFETTEVGRNKTIVATHIIKNRTYTLEETLEAFESGQLRKACAMNNKENFIEQRFQTPMRAFSVLDVIAYGKLVGLRCVWDKIKHEDLRSLALVFEKLPFIQEPQKRKVRLKFELAIQLAENITLSSLVKDVLLPFVDALNLENKEFYLRQETFYQEFVKSIIAYANACKGGV